MEDTLLYGIDWDGTMATDDDAERVHVVNTDVPLIDADFVELCQLIDPLSESNDHGITQYLDTVSFVRNKILSYNIN